ncbi:MAG: hypothetical protein D6705_00860 [Deltaproteobacteria bacterium]|nr:MAG: hypothetical protein D6705_00860 [Deltaproteobacteria bacterium]
MRRAVIVPWILALASGCAEGLPDPDYIEHPRVLAIDGVVDEPMPDPAGTRAEALPFERVTFTPHVADPDGPYAMDDLEALSPTAFACTLAPNQGVGGCLLGARPLDPGEIPECPIPAPEDLEDLDPTNPDFAPPPSPCRLTEGSEAQPAFTVPIDPLFLLGSDVEITWVAGLTSDHDTGRCVADLLAEPGTPLSYDCLVAVRRLAVGPDSTLAALAAQLGVPIEGPPPPDPPEALDLNPRIDTIAIGISGAANAITVASGQLVEAPLGSVVEVTITVTPESEQDYLIVADDDGTPRYETRTERLTGDFSSTWGYIEYGDSQGLEHRNLWTLTAAEGQPAKLPGDVVHLFAVIRDDRTGATFVHVPLRLTAAPSP